METVDVQPSTGKKSPRLAAVARLLFQSDIGQSNSSSYDFQSCRQEQERHTNVNNLDISSSDHGRQEHRAVEVGGGHSPSTMGFEQQAEQLLQQDQALQMDQILDLLGLLLKQQHPAVERETNLPVQQQESTSFTAVADGQGQNDRGSSPTNTACEPAAATARHWVNTDELSHGKRGISTPGDSLTDTAAAHELLQRRRDSNSSVLKCSEQRQQVLMNVHAAAIVAAATAKDDSHAPNSSPSTIVESTSNSHVYLEGKQQQEKQCGSGGSAEWPGNLSQPPSRAMALAAAAAAGSMTFREAGSDSVCRSYNSSSSACRGGQQQPKSGSSSPAWTPFRLGSSADPLATPAETGTRQRDARQLQRLQLQQQLIQQQHSMEQQQLQLQQHMRAQQHLMERHHLLHPQHLQHMQPQEPSGQRQLQELQQHSQQQLMEVQVQRGEAEENIFNEETRHILSKSLDVLMGDANIQVLKDLLMRKTPTTAVGSGSGRDCGGTLETSYGSPTHVTPGDATGFDAALLSLLQQQYRQQQLPQQQSKAEGETLLNRNFPGDLKSEHRMVQDKTQYRKGGNEGDMPLFDSAEHPPAPLAASVTTRSRSCISKSAEEDVQIIRTGQARQQEHLRRVPQRHMPQEQQHLQPQEAGAAFQTNSAKCLSAGFERTSSCQSLRSPAAQKSKNEGLNTKRRAAAEGAAAAASANKRGGAAQRLQQQQQAGKKRARFIRSVSPKDNREQERQSPLNAHGSTGCGGDPSTDYNFSSYNIMSEQEQHECYHEIVRRARLCPAAAAREGSFFETSEDSPHTAELTGASLLEVNMCVTAGAAAVEAGGRKSSVEEERQEGFSVSPIQGQQQSAGAAASGNRLQEERSGDAMCGLNNISDRSSEDAVKTLAEKRMEADHFSDTDKQQTRNMTIARTGQACESAATETMRTRRCSTIPAYRGGRRRVQEPCELALAAARLEQQGHTFTPPFYLRTTPAVATSNSGSGCGSARENCKRSEAAAGAEAKRESSVYDRDAGEGARLGATHSQGRTATPREVEEEHREVEEEEEDMECESLTQQQLTLLKHIYAVLSQAEEYFSFKSALYQLQIKRHLKKCVSSLAAAAASNGASSDKDTSPHTAAVGNRHHRSLAHSGNSPSKAIRLFTSMPPIPINVVEQRALLSVRKHLQAGGGGALLCQGDGFAQLLLEELDELLTSLVNKLLLIIVVKFQTCFIHAPARAQLREFLVSFVFPGDMATQLLFRDHVQAVVHARIRHFRDSVGRTLRHQPPPSPPLAAASLPRSGTKRSSRAAAGSASSPTSREIEEEGDDKEERQKKQKMCEALADFEERDSYTRLATTAAPAGRGLSTCSNMRRLSPAPAASSSVIQSNNSANEIASHSAAARAPMQLESGQGRQSSSINSNERKVSSATRSPRNKDTHRDRFLNSNSDEKQMIQSSGGCASESGVTPGREEGEGRSSRAADHGSDKAAANAAGVFGTAQRKGTTGRAGGPALTSGCGSGSRTRGRLHSRRKRGTTAANIGAEARSPSASSSRYGPAAATRRGGGSALATEKTSNGSAYEGTANHQQQCLREAGNTARCGGAAGGRTAAKAASGAFTSAQRNQRYTNGSAGEDLRQDDHSSSNGQKPEGQRGERLTRAGALADDYLGRTSPAAAQPQTFSHVAASPQRHHPALQQQHCGSTGKSGDVGSLWGSANEKAENCDRRNGGFTAAADGTVDLTGSRNSILSRGSTRESASDPLAWDQVDALHCKSSTNQRLLPSSIHVTTQKALCGDSVDAGGEDVKTTRGAAGERTGPGETPRWTTSKSNVEEDQATQTLAAALGGALDPSNGDSAAAAGEVWEWLAVAAASKDEQQQEKFKQTLETLLNAWTTSGTNESRSLRGMQDNELASSNTRSMLGNSNGGNNTSDGWFNFAGGVFPSTRDKEGRLNQANEMKLDSIDATGNSMHFSAGGMRGKDASLPSPSSIKGTPSEASTSLPPLEERTPPAERSTAASADPDATHSLIATENSTSRRGSTACLPDGSLRTGKATTAGERGTIATRGTAPVITGERGGGAVGSLRLPLPSEVNRTQGTAYQKEASALDNISHNTIADFLLTYCKDDVSAYEIAAELRHRETAAPAATLTSTTVAPGTSHERVQAEAYESSLPDEKLMSSFSLTSAAQITKNSTAHNSELPALLAEALSASHTGGDSLAFSLSSLLASSSPLPS